MTIASLKKPLRILQLDSDEKTARHIIQALNTEGVKTSVDEINSRKQLLAQIKKNTYDLIFLADNAQDCSGADALKAIKKSKVYTPVLVFSDILDEEIIVNYINLGASDFLLKSSLHRLVPVIKRIITNTRNAKIVDYQNFFETSPDLLCVCDKEGCFTAINQSWGHVFGYTDAELIEKPFIQFVHDDDKKSAAAQFQKLFEEKTKTADMICRFVTTTEDVKWLHWKMKIETNGAINVIVRDITESRSREIQVSQAHQNLQKLVELYKADLVKKTLIADQIRDSVVVTDLKGNIVSWNKGSEKVFGYSPEEAVGQHIALIYPEKDYKYIQEEATNVLLEQGSKEFELNMRRKSGEVFESRLSLEVTRDNEGKVNGMLGYAIDMGPVRERAQAVEEQIKQDSQSVATEVEVSEVIKPVEVVAEDQKPLADEDQQSVDVSSASTDAPQELVVAEEDSSVNKSVERAEELLQDKQQSISSEEQAITADSDNQNNTSAEDEIKQEVVEISVRDDGITIMYLEDNLSNIDAVEKILGQRRDYRLLTTQEPEDCADLAKQYLPSLILLDMDHSEADGTQVFKELQQDSVLKDIPVIAVSTDSTNESVQAAKAAGFADYLVKPLQIESFLNVVDSMLGKYEVEVMNKVSSI